MSPVRAVGDYDWAAILRLIRASFAYMDGRIDPPSSMHRLTEADIAAQAEAGEVWVIEAEGAPVACIFLAPKPGRLYLGKLAVAEAWRGRGLARRLVELAEARARALGLPVLELQSRIELAENHATFQALGFVQTGAKAHEGYDRPTSLTFRRAVASGTRNGRPAR
jgi:GNAT superfamily N-acetyltransferase